MVDTDTPFIRVLNSTNEINEGATTYVAVALAAIPLGSVTAIQVRVDGKRVRASPNPSFDVNKKKTMPRSLRPMLCVDLVSLK